MSFPSSEHCLNDVLPKEVLEHCALVLGVLPKSEEQYLRDVLSKRLKRQKVLAEHSLKEVLLQRLKSQKVWML